MPQYLADLLAGFPGFRGTVRSRDWLGPGEDEELTQGGNSGGFGTDPAKRRPGPVDLLSPTSPLRSETALADAYAAPVSGRSSQQQYGSVAPPNPEIIRRAQLASLGAPLQAREPPPGGPMSPLEPRQKVAPHPMGPDVPMAAPAMTAPRSLAGAGQAMPQQGGGGQPQPLLPSGSAPPTRPNFLGKARDWLGGEAFPAGQGMSRGMVLAQALGNFGAGMSRTGRVGPGLEAANQTMMGLREGEQKRAESEEERQYRRLTAEAQLARALKPAAGASSETERYIASLPPEEQEAYRRRRLETLVTEGKAPTTIEGALVDPNASPEIRAQAERLWREKQAPSAKDEAYIRHLQNTGQHQRAMEEIARIKANRPPGTGPEAAPTTLGKLYREMEALPPDDPRREDYRQMIKTETLRGRSGVDAVDREPGYLAPPAAALPKAAEAINTVDDLNARIAGIEAMDTDLPDLMTSPAQGMASLTAAAKRWGVPVSTAQTQYLEKQRTLATQLEDLTSTIRLARAGQTLTGPELASAEKYLPTAGDDVTTLRTKLKELKKIAATARRRNVDILDPKKGIRREPETAAAPPARTAPADAAGTVQLGAPKPGTTFTDDEGKVWRLKGGDPNDKANWELAQ
jgi:hypothetical protein